MVVVADSNTVETMAENPIEGVLEVVVDSMGMVLVVDTSHGRVFLGIPMAMEVLVVATIAMVVEVLQQLLMAVDNRTNSRT
ncbi:hypothetical protein CDL15_Pgr008053 [Punica granatum]|nr:hypothetical protein CDL15_Pgr008053 [Punica granatum]